MTKKIRIESAVCNKCHRDIRPSENFNTLSIRTSTPPELGHVTNDDNESWDGDGSTFYFDLCNDCYESFKELINGYLKKTVYYPLSLDPQELF